MSEDLAVLQCSGKLEPSNFTEGHEFYFSDGKGNSTCYSHADIGKIMMRLDKLEDEIKELRKK